MKRLRQQSQAEESSDSKKPRRSQRISSIHNGAEDATTVKQLPSPVTHNDSTATEAYKEPTVEPESGRLTQISRRGHRTPPPSATSHNGLTSPPFDPSDTQPFTQSQHPANGLSHEVEDEEGEGVWGYLLPLDHKSGDAPLVLRKRAACPVPKSNPLKPDGRQRVGRKAYKKEEEKYEETKKDGIAAGGYLIGRHPECGMNLSSAEQHLRV